MAQPRGAGAGLEALLAAQGRLVLEQQAEPLGVIEGARLGVGVERLVALGHAVQAERVQEIEGRMGEHRWSSVSGSSAGRARWGGRSPARLSAGGGARSRLLARIEAMLL